MMLLSLLKASAINADVEGMSGLEGVVLMLGVAVGAGKHLLLVMTVGVGAQGFGVSPCFKSHSALAAALLCLSVRGGGLFFLALRFIFALGRRRMASALRLESSDSVVAMFGLEGEWLGGVWSFVG